MGYTKSYPANITAAQAAISISSSGNNTVVAGVSGQTMQIIKLVLDAASAVNVILKSGSTALTGAMPLGAIALDLEAAPLQIAEGENFVVNLSSGVAVTGFVIYQLTA